MTTNPLSPELIAHGATFTPAAVNLGDAYWQLIEATGPFEWGGRHSIFIEVLDQVDRRIIGLRVRLFNGGNSFKATEPKPGDSYALDFPIYAKGNAYGVQIADGQPSDSVFGMGLLEFKPHVSYRLVFRFTVATEQVLPTPGKPTQPTTAREAIDAAMRQLEIARNLV